MTDMKFIADCNVRYLNSCW